MHIQLPPARYAVVFVLTMTGCAGMTPPGKPEGGVDADTVRTSHIEAEGATVQVGVSNDALARRVTITVVPLTGVSIPRSPGLSVHRRGAVEVAWGTPMPVRVTGPPGYFQSPPVAVVEYSGEVAVGLEARYAYCVSDSRCYLARVPVDIPARPAP